jgi:replicative DNA helicase
MNPNPPDRLPPHSEEAEAACLGCALVEPKCLPELIEKLPVPECFYDQRHQAIYRELGIMFAKSRPVDVITLGGRFSVADKLDLVGGLEYIGSLPDRVHSVENLSYWAEIVREKWLLRRLIRLGTEAVAAAYAGGADTDRILDTFEQAALALNRDRVASVDMEWRAVMARVIDRMEDYHRGGAQLLGLSTGFPYLDKMTAGFQPAQFIVLAARPGMGKTSLGANIIEHVAVDQNLPVGVFSLEMTAEELGMRAIFQRSGGDMQRFRTGYMKNEDLPRLVTAHRQIADAPICVDETGGLTIMQVRAKARRWHHEHGIRMLVVDYLQLLRGTTVYHSRNDEVAEISGGLKSLAKELRIPVVVLAQLNRELEKERNRLPRLADLRESGSVEQDADLVGMLYEPKEEDEDEHADWSQHSRRVNLLLAKNRHGPTGNVELLFEKACMRFRPYVRTRRQGSP